jgi:hypothetical protein
MTMTDVYCSMNDDYDDTEFEFKLRDRVSDKRIEKRDKQANARKKIKKGNNNEPEFRKDAHARQIRAGRPREVSILQEGSDGEGL